MTSELVWFLQNHLEFIRYWDGVLCSKEQLEN